MLYSIYTSNIGQGKEAAQVAMKQAISDLQKKAAAWEAMPFVSLVALTITVNAVDHDVGTLYSLMGCLSGAARKSLLA